MNLLDFDVQATSRRATEIFECAMLVLPRGWSSATLAVERAGEALRVSKLNVNVDPSGAGRMPPALATREDALATMNEALTRLAGPLEWSGPSARLDRSADGSATLRLLDERGEERSKLALTSDLVKTMLWTDELFDAIDAASDAMRASQTELEVMLRGFRRWGFEMDTSTLSFVLASGEETRGRGVVLGSWVPNGEWLWAWANDSVPEEASAAVDAVRGGAEDQKGMLALIEPSFRCSAQAALLIALLAASRMGAEGIFRGPNGQGMVVIAAMP